MYVSDVLSMQKLLLTAKYQSPEAKILKVLISNLIFKSTVNY